MLSKAVSIVPYDRAGDWASPYRLRLRFITMGAPVLESLLLSGSDLDVDFVLDWAW